MTDTEFFDARYRHDPSGCWLWQGANSGRYGRMYCRGPGLPASTGAHRYSYTRFRGAVPEGLSVLHQCDTPACVNPDHLFLGTQAENMRDMAAKGRAKKWPGESHRDHKLTEADVRAIRKIAPGTPGVAARYGVSDQAIYAVRKGLTWSHVA